MSLFDTALPEPRFVSRDADAVTRDLLALYGELTGKTLFPGQVERVLVDVIAYRETLLREALQDAASLNLLRYSRAPVLDHLGELLGVARLEGEADDALRERIALAPGRFSTAGSVGAYQYHARSAHPDVVDVAVVSPTPGTVSIHPLVATGLPGAGVKAAVLDACSAQTVRPLCDTVIAADPVAVPYTISARLTLYTGTDGAAALEQAQAAAVAHRDRLASRLGVDVVRSQIIKALHGYGVYAVELLSPAADTVLAAQEWATCSAINITVASATAQG